ncbi:HIT domain-containing protein [Candidatus Woesebacteria bacterium]|nr:HIT domain-containing protein [Candidatus Woesebacteria bacterium]QQG47388.1 MAG: HIT domain-containing protein [Candidatus Woesebacteria bacterium]
MKDCIFCKIINREISSKIEKESISFVVFSDIHPKASVHLLIVPKNHIKDINEITDGLWLEIKKIALEIAKERRISGFRLVTNAGKSAAIDHMHVHFLGGVSKDDDVARGLQN